MPNDSLIEHLICPDCRKRIVASSQNTLVCTGCRRSFNLDGNVVQMLPSCLKKNREDDAWKTMPYEGVTKPAWMALLHKKDRILYFHERILPNFDFSGRVLEIGAGTCWASALIKKKYLNSLVVATDISPYALEKGIGVAKLLESHVDYRIACDAELLPFADEYFDVILTNATIHHFVDPQRGICEMWRVLKRGGRSCTLGEVAAGTLFNNILTSRLGPAGKRAKTFDIEERVYSLKKWEQFFGLCGFKDITVDLDKTWENKLYDWFTALYYRFLSTVPDVLIGDFLPCNVDIYATKI